MSYNIYTTDNFDKELKKLAKKHRSTKTDILALSNSLKEDPQQGDPLGKDCYKVRMAITSKGKGKSGGARVITCIKVVEENVYLLAIYDKSDKESISDKELDQLLVMAGLL
jgi:mRNA-degrading endonuclease RelE of RelBE toxin-antitoxin system